MDDIRDKEEEELFGSIVHQFILFYKMNQLLPPLLLLLLYIPFIIIVIISIQYISVHCRRSQDSNLDVSLRLIKMRSLLL